MRIHYDRINSVKIREVAADNEEYREYVLGHKHPLHQHLSEQRGQSLQIYAVGHNKDKYKVQIQE